MNRSIWVVSSDPRALAKATARSAVDLAKSHQSPKRKRGMPHASLALRALMLRMGPCALFSKRGLPLIIAFRPKSFAPVHLFHPCAPCAQVTGESFPGSLADVISSSLLTHQEESCARTSSPCHVAC